MKEENPSVEQVKEPKKNRPWWQRILRILWRTLYIVLVLLILLLLFIRSDWGQNLIIGKATKYVSEKTHTQVEIERLFITFKGNVNLEGLYLEDTQGDTLVYSKKLTAGIPFIPILKGQPISLNNMEWEGLRANISRKDSLEGFNFQFLIDAFVSESEEEIQIQPESEEAGEMPEINIGTIDFSDFKLSFKDDVLGIDSKLKLGKLKFQGKNIDLNKMIFEIEELTLEDTDAFYVQTKEFPPSEESPESMLPYLNVDRLALNNVTAYYESIPDEMNAQIDLKEFLIKLPKADLNEENIEVNELLLHDSYIALKMKKDSPADEKMKEVGDDIGEEVEEAIVFEWPNWNVKVNSIDLDKNQICYQRGEVNLNEKTFNPDYLTLNDLTIDIKDLELDEDENLNADFNRISFKEKNKFELKNLSFGLAMNSEELKIEDFALETTKNKLKSQIGVKYKSMEKMVSDPMDADLALDLTDLSLDLSEAFYFSPELKSNEYMLQLSKSKLRGNVKAKGNMAKLDVSKLNLSWRNTRITTRGSFKNLTDPDQLYLAVDNLKVNTLRNDVLLFVDEKDLGISVPENIYIESKLAGSLDELSTITLLRIPEGEINLNGGFSNKNLIAFHADLDVTDFDLGKILNNPEIGKIEFNLKTEGQGKSVEQLTAKLNSKFEKLELNQYDFAGLEIDGDMVDGEGDASIKYLDDNLNLLLNSHISLDSLGQIVSLDLDVDNADLNKLNLLDKKIKTNFSLMAEFANRDGDFYLESHLIDGRLSYDGKTYLLGPLNLAALIEEDSTNIAIGSRIIRGQAAANADPADIGKAIEKQLKRYFREDTHFDTVGKPIRLEANMKIVPHPILSDVFIPGIVEMDTLNIEVDFDQSQDVLTSYVDLSYLNYEGNIIDNLYFDINSAANVAQFILGFENLDAGQFGMYRTLLSGDLTEGMLTANFFSFDETDEIFFALHSQTSGKQGDMSFRLLPQNLILNKQEWNIPEDNEILVKEKSIEAHNFVLSRNGRELKIANDLIKTRSENIGVGFRDFQLETLLALLNPEDHLAAGNLQGNFVVANPRGKIGFLADLGIDSLEVLQAPLGDLTLKAFSKDLGQYRFKMDLKSDDVDLVSNGSFINNDNPEIKAQLDLNKFGFETISKLSQKEITDATGYLSGKVNIHGDVKSPKYEGFLQFNDAKFKVSQLNAVFALTDDKIDITDQAISLTNFSIEDENNNPFSINGQIKTKKLSNPKFDLKLKTKNFQLMNSSEEHNNEFYGKVNFDLDGTIKGSGESPDINLSVRLNKGTDFIYALSASQASLDSRDGVVEFVNKTAPTYVIDEKKDSIRSVKYGGMNLHANINIDKDVKLGVIVDPRTKDNLEIAGEANLDFRMNPNGQMNLSGRYTVSEGYYRLSLYNLVKRQFDFRPGSTITWAGDPMDADLDVTALYSIKTSAAGLMQSGTSGDSEEERNQYKQRLPFLVSLNVGGSIDRPELNFGLDLEEESKGAMDGAVYSRLRQMQDDEGEINKQVFSLLVLNRFFPDGGSDGGAGGFASMARNNLNQALSDQLNNFSDQLTGESGFRLNFDLESYETYSQGSSQQRTDLDITAEQRLFNDRLVVKAGTEMNIQGDLQPGEERPLLGNVSVEYLLTKDGRWRISGFRKNEYENVIDGQVFTNGVGLMFQKDFSRFGYLWSSLFGNPDKYFEKLRKQWQEREDEEKQKSGVKKETTKEEKNLKQEDNNTQNEEN